MSEEVSPCLPAFPTSSLTQFIKLSLTTSLDTAVGFHAAESVAFYYSGICPKSLQN